jgi:hypothetical protein
MAEGTHSYLDWQISTLMLAYDAVKPLPRDNVEELTRRQQQVEEEVHQLAMATIPASYRQNPEQEFPGSIVVLLTKATLSRAAEIVGILGKGSAVAT